MESGEGMVTISAEVQTELVPELLRLVQDFDKKHRVDVSLR
jgi:hypothetical protein